MEELRKAEKEGTLSQDDHRRLDHEVQRITNEAIDHVDATLKSKEHEIMQV
jgi:ribosome recycling factor